MKKSVTLVALCGALGAASMAYGQAWDYAHAEYGSPIGKGAPIQSQQSEPLPTQQAPQYQEPIYQQPGFQQPAYQQPMYEPSYSSYGSGCQSQFSQGQNYVLVKEKWKRKHGHLKLKRKFRRGGYAGGCGSYQSAPSCYSGCGSTYAAPSYYDAAPTGCQGGCGAGYSSYGSGYGSPYGYQEISAADLSTVSYRAQALAAQVRTDAYNYAVASYDAKNYAEYQNALQMMYGADKVVALGGKQAPLQPQPLPDFTPPTKGAPIQAQQQPLPPPSKGAPIAQQQPLPPPSKGEPIAQQQPLPPPSKGEPIAQQQPLPPPSKGEPIAQQQPLPPPSKGEPIAQQQPLPPPSKGEPIAQQQPLPPPSKLQPAPLPPTKSAPLPTQQQLPAPTKQAPLPGKGGIVQVIESSYDRLASGTSVDDAKFDKLTASYEALMNEVL